MNPLKAAKPKWLTVHNVSTRKEALSLQYNLTLAQIEWAYALSSIVQDFTDLTAERQAAVLIEICGDAVAEHMVSPTFSMLDRLWDDADTLSSSLTVCLLEGLSNPEANAQFFACLERFQQEDLELARLDLIESERLLETATDGIDHSQGDEPIIEGDRCDTNETDWNPIQEHAGRLILRIFNPHDNTHSYFTVDGSLDTTLYDRSHEQYLLAELNSVPHRHEQLAILSIEWHTNVVDKTAHTISGGGTTAQQSMETSSALLEHSLSYTGTMICGGVHSNTFQKGGIDLNTQSLTSDGQLLEHWSIRLHTIQGTHTPLQWNLTHTVQQDMTGNGYQGGHISLESNVYTQIVDEKNQVIASSNPAIPPIPMARILPTSPNHTRSSHVNVWMEAGNIDFSEHVVCHEASTEPIFNQTPPLHSHNEITGNHQGSSNELHGLFFAEMKSKAWQPTQYQKVQLNYQNSVTSNIEGTLVWNTNWIHLKGNILIWSHNEHTRTFDLRKHSDTQRSVEQQSTIDSSESKLSASPLEICIERSTKRHQLHPLQEGIPSTNQS